MTRFYLLCASLLCVSCGGEVVSPPSTSDTPSAPAYGADGKADHLNSPSGGHSDDVLCHADRGWNTYNVFLPFLNGGYGPPAPGTATQPTYPNPKWSTWSTRKNVKLIVYNPVLTDGRAMIEHYGWNDPERLATEYAEAMREATGKAVRFDIVEREVRSEFPPLLNRPEFDAASFQALHDGCKADPALCPTNTCYEYDPQTCPNPEPRADYEAMLDGVCDEVESCQIDEVWLFGGPFLGFYESRMVGDGALAINSGPLEEGCGRRYIVMGFNPEREVNSMLHNVGHMLESYFQYAFRGWNPVEGPLGDDPYAFFRQWRPERDPHNSTSYAVCGDTHWTPTSRDAEYIYNDETAVQSVCDGFYAYPDVETTPRTLTCAQWGCSETGYQKWGFDHVPRKHGTFNGYPNNWWKFVFGFNYYLPTSCQGLGASTCDNAPTCAWYNCDDGAYCDNAGYDDSTMCGNECVWQGDVSSCDAAANCAWYACSESCFPRGTPLDVACP